MYPKISLISAGVNNRFNPPDKETIQKLNKINSKIFIKNKNGIIKLILANKIKIDTVF